MAASLVIMSRGSRLGPSILHPPSSILYPPSSILHPLSSILYPLVFRSLDNFDARVLASQSVQICRLPHFLVNPALLLTLGMAK
jgi:hypothetical protein